MLPSTVIYPVRSGATRGSRLREPVWGEEKSWHRRTVSLPHNDLQGNLFTGPLSENGPKCAGLSWSDPLYSRREWRPVYVDGGFACYLWLNPLP